ncbi:tetratricopeptide repeat protein [Terracoccus sp. 273MFTsu3.1]|uniref:tetratricopeptide repeat protein n=1 Tax=Terracoccus sp. 273MFTsu3.1 TaxID=1172188 RepID=UPI000382A4BD|nr:tetratricopeptide repeat protein [Terracoccus sp. 273MFTsu3.1]
MSGASFVVGEPHFGRFTRTPEENEDALEAARALLTSAVDAAPDDDAGGAVLDAAVDLAEALTIAGREHEALALARPAVDVARDTGRGETLRWALLVLATAEHYADEALTAEAHFREALELARSSGDRVLEHYTLHHLGRLLVDTGRTDEAVACFEACLAIREEQGEPRAESTRAALTALSAAS